MTERNELLEHAVDSIMRGMSEAFDRVWSRPDASALVAGFLDDRIVFQIDRGGVTIAARPLMPSRSRSSGSACASMASSGMASTRPAPNTGMGMRRATTLISGGSTGWQT